MKNVNTDSSVGNAAALRSALEKVRFYLPYFLQYMRLHWEDAEAGGYYERILEVVNAALAVPARQCDVGTAEEQIERFREFCQAEKCGRCRCMGGSKSICIDRCAIAWAQMPYAAQEGGKA